MFKIGEFSKLVKVSARMLRYYESSGLLAPAEVDPLTGYRMYRASQIPLLMRIIALRDMGFQVAQISALLPHFHDAAVMKPALAQKQLEVHAAIAAEQGKLDQIAKLGTQFEMECNKMMIYEVELKTVPSEQVLSLRETIAAKDEALLWEKLWHFTAQHNVPHLGGGYSTYHGDEYEADAVDTEIAIPVASLGENKDGFCYKELPAMPEVATIQFSGSYEGFAPATEKLALWIEAHNYQMCGPLRGFAIASPTDVTSVEQLRTELQVPVQKRK